MKKDLVPILVNRVQLADLLGVNPRTVNKLLEEDMPVAEVGMGGRAARYDVKACFAWYLNRERANLAGDEEGMSPQKARALLDQKRREELDLRLQVRRGELVEAADLQQEYLQVATVVRARLLRIPDAVSDRVVAAASQGFVAVKLLLRAELFSALRELAQTTTVSPEDGPEAIAVERPAC